MGGILPSEAMLKAQEAAKKALGLDETLAEAHLALALIKFQFDWDWTGAEREFRRAINLNPNSATSHYRYAMYLATMSRMSEAMSEMNRAQELDPLSPIVLTAQGRLLHFQRRYDDGIEWHRKALALDPNFVEAHFNLGMVYEQKLMFSEGISEFKKVNRLAGARASFWSAGLGHGCGLAGMSNRARKVLNLLLKGASPLSPVSPFDVAWVYLGLGEKDAALTWMDRPLLNVAVPWYIRTLSLLSTRFAHIRDFKGFCIAWGYLIDSVFPKIKCELSATRKLRSKVAVHFSGLSGAVEQFATER